MNIGFNITREPITKLYAPIIDYFLEKGWEITLFCDYRTKPSEMGYKAYQFPSIEKIPNFSSDINIAIFRDIEEFAHLIQKNNIRAVFFVNFLPICRELKNILTERGYSFISAELQMFFELFLTGKDLTYSDVIYTFSENWKEWWKEYLDQLNIFDMVGRKNFLQSVNEKCIAVGFPEADQCNQFDPDSIKKKYGIPKNKKVVLLFPFPWRIPFGVWSHVVYQPQNFLLKIARLLLHGALRYMPDIWKGIHDLRLTEAIKQFADKNNAVFIVKGRYKNKVPRYLRRIADQVLFDESYYPFTSLELLSIADLSISFYSAVIMESILLGTPSICLAPKGGKDWPGYENWRLMSAFSPNSGSFFNYKGVVYYETVDDFISTFHNKTFRDYRLDKSKTNEFVAKFLGFNDHNASRRIYEDLLHRTKREALPN